MTQKNPYDEFLDFLNVTRSRESLLEENVMLHIRLRGLQNTGRSTILKIILLGLPLRFLLDIIMLPLTLFGRFISVTITSIIIFTIWIFYSISILQCFYLTVFLLTILNIKSVSNYLKCFIFDIGDILTYGLFTKLWIKIYFSQTHFHKNWMSEVPSCLSLHIFNSRQLWGNHPMKTEGDLFFDKTVLFQKEPDKIKKIVEEYWSEYN